MYVCMYVCMFLVDGLLLNVYSKTSTNLKPQIKPTCGI